MTELITRGWTWLEAEFELRVTVIILLYNTRSSLGKDSEVSLAVLRSSLLLCFERNTVVLHKVVQYVPISIIIYKPMDNR